MNLSVLAFAIGSIVFMLLLAAGLVYYIRRALQIRAALAPGWSFDRDEQPIRFWLQLAVVAWAAINCLAKAISAIFILGRLPHF